MAGDKEIAFLDTEVYGNAALFMVRVQRTHQLFKAWVGARGENLEYIANVMAGPYIFVTFNGNLYDTVIVNAMLDGRGPHEIKHISNRVIEGRLMPWEARDEFHLPDHLIAVDHIDLEGVKPPFVGLKMCGARLGAPSIIENPVDHNSDITPEERPRGEAYCLNDLDLTEMLFNECETPLTLRAEMSRTYGVDMRSKTDSQMAEAVFKKRLGLSRPAPIPRSVRYKAPGWACFNSPQLTSLVEKLEATEFRVHQGHGHVIMPDFLKDKVHSATGTYQVGVGGLHSTHDKKVCHVAGDGWEIEDIDLASYYPTLMINADPDILPKHLGEKFIREYRAIYEKRLAAKKSWLSKKEVTYKSVADTLRIALNGTFGKTSSKYSPLYAPAFMLYTVLSGQLGLFLAIEAIEGARGVILSANTDGIVFKYRTADKAAVRAAVQDCARRMGPDFEFEHTAYRCIAMKDVNNYIAVKAGSREVKAKGLYAPLDIRKNPAAYASSKAVAQWLSHGTPLEETIRGCTFKEFLSARNVTGGGQQGDEYVGKVVRWYLSNAPGLPPLTYVSNGGKVAKTDGSRACMVYDPAAPLPADLDYLAYNKEAIRIAKDVGAAEYLSEAELALVAKPPRQPRRKAALPVQQKEAA